MGRPFQFSVNEVFRIKAEHFSFKMKVLARYSLRNSCRRNSSHSCNVGKIGVFNTSFRSIYEAIIKFSVYFQNVKQINIVSFIFAKRRP